MVATGMNVPDWMFLHTNAKARIMAVIDAEETREAIVAAATREEAA